MAVSQLFTMLFAGLGIVGALVPWEQACSSGWCHYEGCPADQTCNYGSCSGGWCTYGDCESGLCSYGSCSGGHCCYSKCVGSGCEFDSCSGGGCSYNSNCSGIRSPVAIAGISGLCVLACCCMVCCYFVAFCWCRTLPNKSMPVITVAPSVGRMQQTVLETMSVTVPCNVSPGPLLVSTPCGQVLDVHVPEGLTPGQTFNVKYMRNMAAPAMQMP
mmetsp:Transcript_12286/g.21812  ORF Transcript_12286/g.21812 Transcript_12286/m.21812 type:complete len:215 (-) Transcript_12286:272-916(-)